MTNIRLTPMKAIKRNCIDCSAGSPKEVKNCIIVDCPLYEYRLGKNPRRKGIGNSKPKFLKVAVSDDKLINPTVIFRKPKLEMSKK